MPSSLPEPQSWTVERLSSASALDALDAEWRALQARSPNGSIFTSIDYVRLAWRHFHADGDELLVLALRVDGRLEAVAPFRLTHQRLMHIPARVVDWLATWEGDRPGLVCAGDPRACWARIERWFADEFRGWDLLRLNEIAAPVAADGALARASFVETETDSIGYHIPIEGRFDDYLARIDSKVKSNWRNRSRKIFALAPPPQVERIDTPEAMEAAVDRFIRLERTSWKEGAGLGLGKDAAHRDFYVDLARTLAARGEAALCFLSSGAVDLAATLLFLHRGVVYERHIAYNPEHASLSPGIVLRVELLKDLYGGDWREFDLMGMKPALGRQRHKADWALAQRETVAQQFFRRRGRLLPLYLARRLRERLQASRTAPAEAAAGAG